MNYEIEDDVSCWTFDPRWREWVEKVVVARTYVECEDGSFDHDWAGGGTEHRTDAYVTHMEWTFRMPSGKLCRFNPDSGATPAVGEYEEGTLTRLENEAIRQAVREFEYPEDFF